jgi:cohesin loading factor subunit SCC2
MTDEDEGVKDLAMKTLQELWFEDGPAIITGLHNKPPSAHAQDKAPLIAKVSVIMGVGAKFGDRQSPLEDLLQKLVNEKDGANASSLHHHYTVICEVLIDGLVDASDLPGFVCAIFTCCVPC